MRILFGFAAVLTVGAASLDAQQAAYVPSNKLPNGKEIVAIYFGAQSCGPCHLPAVKEAVRQMKGLVAAQARKSNAAFSVVGVANDWDQAVATNFLSDVGPFDQVAIGGNWTNVAIERFVWADSTGNPAMPQILVIERTVKAGTRITISEPRVLRRLVGGDQIPEWVGKGAPISPQSLDR
jgi:hypothetical protein